MSAGSPAVAGPRTRREQGAVLVLAGTAGGPPACRAARRGAPGMRASGPRSRASRIF